MPAPRSTPPSPPSAASFVLRRIERLEEASRRHVESGDVHLAVRELRQACRLRRRHAAGELEALSRCLRRLGDLLQRVGRAARARIYYRAAGQRLEALLRQRHPELFVLPVDSGVLRHRRLDYELSVGQALNRLAHLYLLSGDGEAARPLVETSLAIARPHLGVAHPDFAVLVANLAQLEHTAGRFDEAGDLYRQALKMLRAALGETHEETIRSQLDWASLLVERRRPSEAVALVESALEASRRAWGEAHERLLEPLGRLALLYGELGDWTAAEWHLWQARAILEGIGEAPEWAELSGALSALERRLEELEGGDDP